MGKKKYSWSAADNKKILELSGAPDFLAPSKIWKLHFGHLPQSTATGHISKIKREAKDSSAGGPGRNSLQGHVRFFLRNNYQYISQY